MSTGARAEARVNVLAVGSKYGIIKGYCTCSWINCGMANSLVQALACEGLLASELAIPQLIQTLLYTLSHILEMFCIILGIV